ncbi:MAG TPA: hypothetical protein VL992_12095 [Tepidisphaeraceae bacterium]|nr:hypothetical protein [Tepidisphaeraceae bacterium]
MTCTIETTQRFRSAIKGYEALVAKVLVDIQSGFGNPHRHSGLGIRKLAPNLFECRAGLKLRLIFLARKGTLTFDFAGDHENVQTYLRGRR